MPDPAGNEEVVRIMSDRDQEKKPLSLNRSKLELSKTVEAGQVRQNFSHGRSKSVTVEVRKKRTFEKNESGRFREVKKDLVEEQAPAAEKPKPEVKKEPVEEPKPRPVAEDHGNLTDSERAARMAALKAAEERRKQEEVEAKARAEEEAARQGRGRSTQSRRSQGQSSRGSQAERRSFCGIRFGFALGRRSRTASCCIDGKGQDVQAETGCYTESRPERHAG